MSQAPQLTIDLNLIPDSNGTALIDTDIISLDQIIEYVNNFKIGRNGPYASAPSSIPYNKYIYQLDRIQNYIDDYTKHHEYFSTYILSSIISANKNTINHNLNDIHNKTLDNIKQIELSIQNAQSEYKKVLEIYNKIYNEYHNYNNQ
jgi:hypothetical protein